MVVVRFQFLQKDYPKLFSECSQVDKYYSLKDFTVAMTYARKALEVIAYNNLNSLVFSYYQLILCK